MYLIVKPVKTSRFIVAYGYSTIDSDNNVYGLIDNNNSDKVLITVDNLATRLYIYYGNTDNESVEVLNDARDSMKIYDLSLVDKFIDKIARNTAKGIIDIEIDTTGYIDSNGIINGSGNFYHTKLIPVELYHTYVVTFTKPSTLIYGNATTRIHAYNSEGNWIKQLAFTTPPESTEEDTDYITKATILDSNIKYIKLSYDRRNINYCLKDLIELNNLYNIIGYAENNSLIKNEEVVIENNGYYISETGKYTSHHSRAGYSTPISVIYGANYNFKISFKTDISYVVRVHGYDSEDNWIGQLGALDYRTPLKFIAKTEYALNFTINDERITHIRISMLTYVNTLKAVVESGSNIIDTIININDNINNITDKIGTSSVDIKTKHDLKILCIGNSFTLDAFSYVPYIVDKNEINLTIGILYIGGSQLSQHYTNLVDELPNYTYYKKEPNTDNWVSSASQTIQYGIEDDDWDIIVFQQLNTKATYYATCQPYLNNMINIINGLVSKDVKLLWHMSSPYPDNNTNSSTLDENTTAVLDSVEMYEKILATAQRVIQETPIDGIIANGTAIQNARTTSLDEYGETGHCCYDKKHLQEGIGPLTLGYYTTIYIYNLLGIHNKSIFGNKLRPTSDWISSCHIPGPHGGNNVVGISDENCLIAQKCAIMAIKDPYHITDCSSI